MDLAYISHTYCYLFSMDVVVVGIVKSTHGYGHIISSALVCAIYFYYFYTHHIVVYFLHKCSEQNRISNHVRVGSACVRE